MSNEAITWALSVPKLRATDKFVLVILANHAGEDRTCFPSQAQIIQSSCLNRKTVIAALQRLMACGLIIDTGKRHGVTRQVIAYRLSETIPETVCYPENGTVPDLPDNSPVFPDKGSRISREQSRKRDTEPSEPSITLKEPKRARAAKSPAVVLPDWMPADAWNDFIASRTRRGKAPTDQAVRLLVKHLGEFRDAGQDVAAILNRSTMNGWTGIFAEDARGKPKSTADPFAWISQLSEPPGHFDERLPNGTFDHDELPL